MKNGPTFPVDFNNFFNFNGLAIQQKPIKALWVAKLTSYKMQKEVETMTQQKLDPKPFFFVTESSQK
jgi:hypothetical protein